MHLSNSELVAETRSFQLLDSRVQRWIWKQGWTSLLEIQENTIPLVLDGRCDVIVSAPTGGGKTEAVFLPIISKMLNKPIGAGYYVLYISPLKALINDQTRRLTDLCEEIGVGVTSWHGDISVAKKSQSFKEPRGIMIITPESLESILMHRRDGLFQAFSNLSYIVIDEIHSFVGKERGKQIQSLISRIDFIAGRTIPRIGMSATLSDFEDIKRFIRPDRRIPCEVPKAGEQTHEIQVLVKEYLSREDNNCGEQIAEDLFLRLRKSNNLVFTQSRATAEDFTILLSEIAKREGVPNEFLIHHSSIDKEDRRFLEQTLQEGRNPTTAICTSTLELGIDVGSVKSVAQIGTCPSVSSLRQRLGRSGRRNAPSILRVYNIDRDKPNDVMACLSFSLVQNIAMIELIRENRYEPYNVDRYHFSTLIQQILSVLAQYGSFYPKEGWMLLCKNGAFSNVTPDMFLELLQGLGKESIISQTHTGQIVIGEIGEKIVKDIDFYAAFTASPDVLVIEKRSGKHIGTINEDLKEGSIFVLSGRYWLVLERDNSGTRLFVEQTRAQGDYHFSSPILDIDRIIVEKMREVYLSSEEYPYLDGAAKERLELARHSFAELGLQDKNVVTITFGEEEETLQQQTVFFTWAGTKINRAISLTTKLLGEGACSEGPYYIMGFTDEIAEKILAAGDIDPIALASLRSRHQKESEKYDDLVPDNLLNAEYAQSHLDVEGMMTYLKSRLL